MCAQCDGDFSEVPVSRRGFIAGGIAAGTAGLLGVASRANGSPISAAINVAPELEILPRDTWGADLAPKGPMGREDVRFLLVHHTESPNDFRSQRDLIRIVYSFHTGPQKRWNDVAYNFFVGPDGTVWEGRAGSLAGPVVASATGGNQGHSQLVCLLGDFRNSTPPTAMQTSLVRLLTHLADRYKLVTSQGARAEFVSRGSNKLAAGALVSTSTISGHLDMSFTDCPGAGAYQLLPTWRRQVDELARAGRVRTGLQRAERLGSDSPGAW